MAEKIHLYFIRKQNHIFLPKYFIGQFCMVATARIFHSAVRSLNNDELWKSRKLQKMKQFFVQINNTGWLIKKG